MKSDEVQKEDDSSENKAGTTTVPKKDNPMIVKAGTATVKYRKLREKSQIIKPAKAIKVSKAKGKLVYKYIKAKKGKQNFRKYFKIGTRSGKVKVRKGLKRGTYRVKVKVRAMGDSLYKASPWKTVIFKVRVK